MSNNAGDVKFRDSVTNLEKAFGSLKAAVVEPITNQRDVAGLIKNFEFVYELSWIALKRLLELEGRPTGTPKHVFSEAYVNGLISDEQLWLEMIRDRNLTVHTYDDKLARDMVVRIQSRYFPTFEALLSLLKSKVK